ncbi:MAG: hypothetical protein Q8862_12635 [Bacteroidota bacterium]|nr:hypothetical protein [Bacteroidota bacterium]
MKIERLWMVAWALAMTIVTNVEGQRYSISNFRPYDKNGINIFETSKMDSTVFEGLKVRVGGNFVQSFQDLRHSNRALPKIVNGSNVNSLVNLSSGFNTAEANLNLDVQLADGVRMNLVSYLSSRHHQETWVKGGYIQFDKLPFLNSAFFDEVMQYATIKIGHMEINYGDAHFRRSDNGNTLYNPFLENYILDAYDTEIGGEINLQHNGYLGVLGITSGEIKGDVIKPPVVAGDNMSRRSPAFYGKLGFDKNLDQNLRLRITGSGYYTPSSVSNELYGGDRSGSHYYFVMENQATTSQFYSGRLQPGFSDKVRSLMGNVFLKYYGLEFFGTLENAKGRSQSEATQRTVNQIAGDVVYRFGENENFYVGTRYNTVLAELAGINNKVRINRIQVGGGWFPMKNMLLKGEFVAQRYKDFPDSNILAGGKFHGVVMEAVVGF